MTKKIIKKTASTKRASRGQLTNAECAKISKIIDQVIAGKLSLHEGERRAEAIRTSARRRGA